MDILKKTGNSVISPVYFFRFAIIIVLLTFMTPIANALWAERVHIGGSITTGTWITPQGQSGTTLSAEVSAVGFTEMQDDFLVHGVRGYVCAENGGAVETRDLNISTTVQIKTSGEPFSDYLTAVADVNDFPVLGSGEKFCYPYKMIFELPDLEKVIYRLSTHVTITNHSGWLPGGNNCPGPEVCPFGPKPKADFIIPISDAPESTATATATSTPTSEVTLPVKSPTASNTPGAPTNTPAPPTASNTPGAPTNTPVPPTASNTPDAPTNTPVPPTATNTPEP